MFRRPAILLAGIIAMMFAASSASGQSGFRDCQRRLGSDDFAWLLTDYAVVLQRYNVSEISGAGKGNTPDIQFASAYEVYNRAFRYARKQEEEAKATLSELGRAYAKAMEWYQEKEMPLPSPLDANDATALSIMMGKVRSRVESNKQEVLQLGRRAVQLHAAACAAEKDRPANAGTRTILIASATYGQNCARFKPHDRANTVSHGNATKYVAGACNGKQSCTFTVRWQEIGDPAFGCQKDFRVEYLCGDGKTRTAGAGAEAGHGSVVTMNCQ